MPRDLRVNRLPPYVFNIVNNMKLEARQRGEDVIDFGMGNPDQPPSPHIIEKLVEAVKKSKNHRYSASRGIERLRHAITDRYQRKYNVTLDPETEAVVTIGSKEGISHLAMALFNPGEPVMVPTPTYPIHSYSVIIAGGEILGIPVREDEDFFENMVSVYRQARVKPRVLLLNFPHNPTTTVVDMGFFEKVVEFAREHDLWVIHDFAYADLVFDGYQAPSMLQVPGAKDVAVEFFTLSKSYNMPGWRVGFCVGNPEIVGALTKIKSYMDYGIFQPIQIASIIALNSPDEYVEEVVRCYHNRLEVLVNGLCRIGWKVEKPRATMFVWARIPEPFREMGSLEFCKQLLLKSQIAVAPGIGFGEHGDGYVRFALVENEHRTRQAIQGIKKLLTS